MTYREVAPNHLLMRARRRLTSPSGSGREMSRQELADAVNAFLWARYRIRTDLDATYVGHLEQGRHRWPQARRREAFRHVLGATTDAELGFYITRHARLPRSTAPTHEPRPRPLLSRSAPSAIAHPKAAKLIAALTAHPALETSATEEVDGAPELNTRLAKVRAAYQQGRYTIAFEELPPLLLRIQLATADHPKPQAAWWATIAESYQVASGLLLKADEPTLASIAADRSINAARASDDPLVIGSSIRAVVHALLASGHANRAAQLAVTAAEELRRTIGHPSTESRSLYGALLLRGSIAAARNEDRHLAQHLLTESAAVADEIGDDGNAHWTAFGSTNVHLHRVAAAVLLGDAGTAVEIAATVDLAQISLAERRASFLIDTARAFAQWGKLDKALEAVRAAEQHAPDEVHTRRSVHHLIIEIAERAPTSLRRDAQAYARSIGLPA